MQAFAASLFGRQEENVNSNSTGNTGAGLFTSSAKDPEEEEEEENDIWGKIQNFFFKPEPETINQPPQNVDYSRRLSIRDRTNSGTVSTSSFRPKGPLVRTESVPAHVQRKSGPAGGSRRNIEKPNFPSSAIPESFKQSFDLSLDVEEEPLNSRLGVLEFSTIYLFEKNTLFVKILKAINLPAMDLSGTSDPFVKCCLLPDRKRKLETKTRRKTLNPVWNEVLSFEGLAYEKIKQRVLYLQVYDYDRFSRNDPIGEICLPLHTIDLSQEVLKQIPLQPCERSNKRGELLLTLCYQPIEGELEIGVQQGRNLKPMDLNGTSDPYVKIWLTHRNKRIEKKKTEIKKNTLNPTFNKSFLFNIPMAKLRDVQFEITVMDYDTIGRNDTIGKIYLGHKSAGLEKQHWKDMLAHTRQLVSQWHVLKI